VKLLADLSTRLKSKLIKDEIFFQASVVKIE